MKKLIAMIPTEGKTKEQVIQEAQAAIQKSQTLEKKEKISQKNFLTSAFETIFKTLLFIISWLVVGWLSIKFLEFVLSAIF